MDSDEDDFGPTVPPLSVYIRGILQRYPDGSQLKELLQNAEDAGARTIKFIYDTNSYNSGNLFLHNLSHCQGPSLCAYNDAKFEPCDWKGIQQPQRSHKADSVLKVGKFGIGFNSVYHLTETPWILSGDKLAVIEPTESLLNGEIRGVVKHRTGFNWRLTKKAHQREICGNWNQFVPIETAAKLANNVGFTKHWNYDGTLFRLPLRTAQSTISSTNYNESMIDELFQSFSGEMFEILLFLSDLECIELLKINSQREAAEVNSVRIPSFHLKNVRQSRADVHNSINKIVKLREMGKAIENEMTENMTMEIEDEEEYRTWIVSHFLPKQSNAPKSWALEKGVKRLPWVSLAAPVDDVTIIEGVCNETNNFQSL